MPVLVMDYPTKPRYIQSARLSPRKMNRRWSEIAIPSLQCKMFGIVGVVDVRNSLFVKSFRKDFNKKLTTTKFDGETPIMKIKMPKMGYGIHGS